jgi:glycosyltransferase involved in cell wall biosynthesis
MKILFFSSAFPQPDDASRSPYNLHRCKALANNHDVRVISPLNWRNARARRDSNGIEALTGGLRVDRPTFFYPPRVLRGTHAWWMWHSVRDTALRVCREFQPDVILSYWTYPDGAAARRLASTIGVPCVSMVGGSDVLAIDGSSPDASARRIVGVLESVDAIATVSEDLKARICALGLPAAKVHVLPPAVDTSMFSPGDRGASRRGLGLPEHGPVLLWIGRMVEVKAIDVLLKACRAVVPAFPNLQLHLIGDGPLRASLFAQVQSEGLSGHVVFAGRVAQQDLPVWYRAADAVVLPSRWEGTPNVLLESHACLTPFVATEVGAIPEIAIDGFDELVATDDIAGLAAAMSAVLRRGSNPGAVNAIPVGGWGTTAGRLGALLEAVCQSHNHSRSVSIDECFADR